MISTQIRTRLIGINDMIPEYAESIKLRDEIKDMYLDYLNNHYLTDKDHDLISKYPDYILTNKEVFIVGRYSSDYCKVKVESLGYEYKEHYSFRDFYRLTFSEPIICINTDMIELKELDKKFHEYMKPKIIELVNTRNIYVKKYRKVSNMLTHKNLTLRLIKEHLPKVYEKYKSND